MPDNDIKLDELESAIAEAIMANSPRRSYNRTQVEAVLPLLLQYATLSNQQAVEDFAAGLKGEQEYLRCRHCGGQHLIVGVRLSVIDDHLAAIKKGREN